MTIIEAMGTGLPIVASNVGGVPDMIEDKVSGMLTTVEPEAVAEAVLMLLGDRSLRETLGTNAKKDSKRFSAAYMAEQYCGIYNK